MASPAVSMPTSRGRSEPVTENGIALSGPRHSPWCVFFSIFHKDRHDQHSVWIYWDTHLKVLNAKSSREIGLVSDPALSSLMPSPTHYSPSHCPKSGLLIAIVALTPLCLAPECYPPLQVNFRLAEMPVQSPPPAPRPSIQDGRPLWYYVSITSRVVCQTTAHLIYTCKTTFDILRCEST